MRLILKLFLTTLAPYLLCVPTIIWLGNTTMKKVILERTISAANFKLDTRVDQISDYFKNWIGDLNVMSRTPEMITGSLQTKLRYLSHERKIYGDKVDGLYYGNPQGRVYSTSGSTFTVRDRYYYSQLLKGKTFVSHMLISRDTGHPVILILVPINDATGKYTGTVSATVPYDSLLQKIRDNPHVPGEWTFFLDNGSEAPRREAIDENIRVTNSGQLTVNNAEMDGKLAEIMSKTDTTSGPVPLTLGNQPYLAFSKRVSGTPCHLISLRLESEIFHQVTDLQKLLILIASLILSVSLISTLTLYLDLVRPIRNLMEVHDKFGHGEITARAPIVGDSEIAALAASFNTMADKLQAEARDREAAEAKALDANLQLLRTVKLASIGEIAAGVAHEINNPLAIIQGNLEKMHRLHNLLPQRPTEIDSLSEKLVKAALRIRKIVDELRLFVRKDSMKIEVFSIHESVVESVNMFMNILESSNIRLQTHFCKGEPRVKGSQDKFQQVIFNLVANARDAVERSGFGLVTITTEIKGDDVIIEVTDNGPGVREAHLEKIFDPFFTTKPKGTGLGLAISQSLITEMQGKLSVSSVPDVGTTFTIRLPCTHEVVSQPASDVFAVEKRNFSGRALILDDDAEVGEVLGEMLRQLGIEAEVVTAAHDAYLRLRREKFEWFFTDYQLPQMSGLKIVETFADQNILPAWVYLVTGGVSVDTSNVKSSVLDQVRGILYKPFSQNDLSQFLSRDLT